MTAARLSPTLAINEEVQRLVAAGTDVLHLGFGEAGLPVHPLLRDALAAAAGRAGYGPVAGGAEVRTAIAGYYTRRGVETDASQIAIGPGSKALLFGLLLALDGDLVLPQPAWVSYAAQAALAGKRVVRVPIPAECGGIPDPEALADAVRRARADGLDPRLLVVTQPDNPTGTLPSRSMLERTLECARSCGLFVISDEIYADLAYDPAAFTSAAALDGENCVVTGGLSKSQALGGWRLGTLRVPATSDGRRLRERLCAIASEVWSCVAAPVEQAAVVAFGEPPELVAHVHTARSLHAQVATAVHEAVTEAGARCRTPTAGFYLYPDVGAHREALAARGIRSGEGLAAGLLDGYGIVVLPGAAFGEADEALRFRIATSLLYGATDADRWQALESASAGEGRHLPTVVDASERLRSAFHDLLRRG